LAKLAVEWLQGVGLVMPAKHREEGDGARLSIGALARATGVAVETLRTWESRYGFPVPERKPSGHRVYPVSAVPRLRRIAQALSLGHRAGQVVGASEEALGRLLETSTAAAPAPASTAAAALPPVENVPGLLRLVKAFDGERLNRLFLGDWARMGPVEFLEARLAPLLRAVGEAWEQNDLEIRHEHFLSERVGDLQMSALVLAAAGCRVLSLGTEVPIPQVASLARDLAARAVAISVSSATKGPASAAALRKLRDALPRRVLLVAGGDGAPAPRTGAESVRSLRDLDAWGRRLAAGLPVERAHEPRL
jgi:hypothetical protein